jgi:Ni/Co efflux regulator RcnB
MLRIKGRALVLSVAAVAAAFAASAQDYGRRDHGRGGEAPRGGYRSEPRGGQMRYGYPGGEFSPPEERFDGRPGRGYWREYLPRDERRFGPGPGPDLAPTFRHWGRGQVLPPANRVQPIYDFQPYHLRRPPYGYQWYRVGGDFVLASIGAGLIFEVIEADR